MLKKVIKRDGSVEDYVPHKLNKWAEWASENLGDRVDWSTIVLNAVRELGEETTTVKIQEALIRACLDMKSWPYHQTAGRLYGPHLQKQIFPNGIPSLKDQIRKLESLNIIKHFNYTDEELDEINGFIDHNKDYNLAQFQAKYIKNKYALQNRITKEVYETPQFTAMRLALTFSEYEAPENRLALVKDFYDYLSDMKLGAPTPSYIHAGTGKSGMASCCLIVADDDKMSIRAALDVAYDMSADAAGIGTHMMLRAKGDPVRGGTIVHKGMYSYQRALGSMTKANTQGGRGSSVTSYYSVYHPEASFLAQAQDVRATEHTKLRDLHFCAISNRLFAKKVRDNKDIFQFTPHSAPDLWKAQFSGDQDKFEELYNKYENDPNFEKTYINARDLIVLIGKKELEVGTNYEVIIDEINRHTPFLEPIYSSNLCVAPETKIITDHGEFEISEKVNQKVNIWNGFEWSEVVIRQTSYDVKLIKVILESGEHLYSTLYHKWYININGDTTIFRTSELQEGMGIVDFKLPDGTIKSLKILSIIDDGRVDDTYCCFEPKRNSVVFNGVMTSNCVEITEHTHPYRTPKDLYSEEDTGHVLLKTNKGDTRKFPYSEAIWTSGKSVTYAGRLMVGDKFINDLTEGDVEVVQILESTPTSEVALCNLASIIVSNIDNDKQYEKACYLALKMIDYTIINLNYSIPNVGYTAKNRMNAGVGMTGLAHHLAKKGLKYDTQEGLEEIHRLAERHSYFLIKASLRISKERGLAPWMHKTKWPQGWLPIDTYKKSVDEIVNIPLQYDWEKLRSQIITNGGIGHSSLVAYMPTESSSKPTGMPNGPYPVRDISLNKSDETNVIEWCAKDSDILDYQIAYDIDNLDMVKFYAILQKFTDHSISADFYRDRTKDLIVTTSSIIEEYLHRVRFGVKSKYYQQSLTNEETEAKLNEDPNLGIIDDFNITTDTEEQLEDNSSIKSCPGGYCDV